MSTKITCPSCNAHFEPTDALRDEIQKELRNQMIDWQKKKEEEFLKKEEQFRQNIEDLKCRQEKELQQKMEEERRKLSESIQEEVSKKLAFDYESKLRFLENTNKEREEQLKTARERELTFLKKQEELERKEQEMEIEKQRLIREERMRLTEELKKQTEEKEKHLQMEFQLKQKEWEVKFEQQQKALEEARKKAVQGSVQLQGEVQELLIEDILRQSFPTDIVREIKKGAFGADCHITIRNKYAQECGTILLESKRAKEFSNEWILKLKNDMVARNADIAIIVSQVLPKDMDGFGHKDGIYICSLVELKHLIAVLRQGMLKIYEARKSQENKGEKMVMLYNYLTGSEFVGQWTAMRESFQTFRASLQKERDDFEKNWKKKQKLLDTIINNSLQISGSIEGISGTETIPWNSLPENSHFIEE